MFLGPLYEPDTHIREIDVEYLDHGNHYDGKQHRNDKQGEDRLQDLRFFEQQCSQEENLRSLKYPRDNEPESVASKFNVFFRRVDVVDY